MVRLLGGLEALFDDASRCGEPIVLAHQLEHEQRDKTKGKPGPDHRGGVADRR